MPVRMGSRRTRNVVRRGSTEREDRGAVRERPTGRTRRPGGSASSRLIDRYQRGRDKKPATSFKNYIDPEKAKDVQFFKPKEGISLLDIIPYATGGNDIYDPPGETTHCCEVFVHKNVGPANDMYLCLNEHGDGAGRCPVCKERDRLRNSGANDDVVNALWPQRRNIYNVHVLHDREEMEKGVQLLDLWFEYMEDQLLRKAQKPVRKGQRVVSPNTNFASEEEDGKSIEFNMATKNVRIRGKKATVPEFTDHEFIDRDGPLDQQLLDEAWCIDELLIIPTPEEVEASLFPDGMDAHLESEKEAAGRSRVGRSGRSDTREQHRDRGRGRGRTKGIDDFEYVEDLIDHLAGLRDDDLMDFINFNGLDIIVDEFETVDEAIDVIASESGLPYAKGQDRARRGRSRPSSSVAENECPYGYQFGVDTDAEDDCSNCPPETWEACFEEQRRSRRGERERGRSSRGRR